MKKNIGLKVVLSAVLLITLNGCGSSKEREQQYLEKAKDYVTQQNFDKARLELKNVLQINPKNIEARFLLVKLAEKDHDWQKMYDLLSAITRDKPDFLEAQLKLGVLFLMRGDLEKVAEKIEAVFKTEPNNTDAMTLKAALFLRNNDRAAAEAMLDKVLTLDVGNVDASYLLVNLNAKKPVKALSIIETALSHHPDDVNLALLKVQFLTSMNQLNQAQAVIQNLLMRFPDDAPMYYAIAKYYIMARQFDKAEQLLRELISRKPLESEPKIALAEYFISQKNEAKAEQVLLEFSRQNPRDFELSFALVALYKKQPNKAAEVLRQIIEADGNGPSGLKAKTLLAAYAQSRGDRDQALQLLEQVLKKDAHHLNALMLRSSLRSDQGQYDDAIADLRAVLSDQPNSEKALLLSARTQIKSGYFDLAQESLENVLEINPANLDARKDLARMLVKNKDPDSAINLLENSSPSTTQNIDVLAMLVDLYIVKANWEKAEEVAKSIQSFDRNSLSQFKLAQVYFAQKKYPAALASYQKVLTLKPLSIEALTGLTETFLSMGEARQASAELDKLLVKYPENIELLNLRGFLYRSQQQFADAEKLFSRIIELKPNVDSAYRNLALVYLMQNQLEKAKQAYQAGLNAIPDNLNLLLGLAELHDKSAQTGLAIEMYSRVLQIAPDSQMAANNLAVLIANTSDDPKRLNEAYALVKIFKDAKEPALLDTFGWLSFLNGEVNDAISALEKAVELNSTIAEFHYHLGMAYAAKNRNDDAKSALKKALINNVEFPGIAKARAKLDELER